jgi:hypothetical protein
MSSRTLTSCLALGAVLTLGACNNFLTGEGLSTDPNNPTQPTAGTLFVGAQANLFFQMEGPLARQTCIWMQQCAGVNSVLLSLGRYQYQEDDFFTPWQRTYGGGGLIDLRRIDSLSLARGDSSFAGVSLVVESYLVGTSADVWGDIPYSQAGDLLHYPTPALDPQQQVYATIQAKLDTAIVYLAATSPTNQGPQGNDLVYGGDPAKWTALAHTLKARYFLHTAEQLGESAYQSALDETAHGIASPADDYHSVHGTDPTQANIWNQYTNVYATLIAAGKFMVDALVDSGDARIANFYVPLSTGPTTYVGAAPGAQATPGGDVSRLAAINTPDASQPLVTWAENQLIAAESYHALGNDALARSALNAVLEDAGRPDVSPTLTGQPLLAAIMHEKYIREFENIEAWSDYRRTCLPALVPAAGNSVIPGRLIWPLSERNANPNIPAPSQQPTRNWNDPHPCP